MKTSRPHLEKVINAGIRTVVYAGDADYICNYQGVENMVGALRFTHSSQYASTPWTEWKVDGVTVGRFKNAGSFSYVRVYRFVLRSEASHQISPRYFQGWPLSSCLYRRKSTVRAARPYYVQPGDGWPTDLLDGSVAADS